jgi:hypothetical protein
MQSVNQQSCLTCDFRPDRIFCDMPVDSLTVFEEIKSVGIPGKQSCSPKVGA